MPCWHNPGLPSERVEMNNIPQGLTHFLIQYNVSSKKRPPIGHFKWAKPQIITGGYTDPEKCNRKQVGPGFMSLWQRFAKVFFKVWFIFSTFPGDWGCQEVCSL